MGLTEAYRNISARSSAEWWKFVSVNKLWLYHLEVVSFIPTFWGSKRKWRIHSCPLDVTEKKSTRMKWEKNNTKLCKLILCWLKHSFGFFHKMFWKNSSELFSQPNISNLGAVGTQRREHPGSTAVSGQSFLEEMDRNFTLKDLGGHGRPQKNVCVRAKLLQSHVTACDPVGGSPQAPLSMGTGQARILEGVVSWFSRGSSRPRDRTQVFCVSCIRRWVVYYSSPLGSLEGHEEGSEMGTWGPVWEWD